MQPRIAASANEKVPETKSKCAVGVKVTGSGISTGRGYILNPIPRLLLYTLPLPVAPLGVDAETRGRAREVEVKLSHHRDYAYLANFQNCSPRLPVHILMNNRNAPCRTAFILHGYAVYGRFI